jgi:hypothetical protein
MNLSKAQINFLNEKFFRYNAESSPSFRVAEKLLETGECIVSGEGRIWNGGVGNFIKICSVPNGVGCSLLQLNRVEFLESDWVKKFIKEERDSLESRIDKLKLSIKDLDQLLGYEEESNPFD